MTTIVANINISGTSEPLDGYIRVVSESDFSDETTLFVPVVKTFNLTAGSTTFELEPSDVAKVAYRFEVWQHIPDTTETDEDGNQIPVVVPDMLLKSFSAVVPYSDTPINLKDLAAQVGVRYDAQDAALLTLSKYLYSSDTFWAALGAQLWNHRGEWDASQVYKRGDVITYGGSGYQYVAPLAAVGKLPTDTTYWRLLAAKGDTGTGTSGNDEPYGATWDGAMDAASRNALYAKIQTLATQAQLAQKADIDSPVFIGNPQAPTQPVVNNSNRLATTAYVQNNLNLIGQVPVGTIAVWGTTSAPLKWRVLQNPGEVVSQSTFADLFAIYGATYNTGGEPSGTFRLPSSASLPVLSSPNMRWCIYTGV